jgi:GGDEF domain-containing protein
MSTATKIELEQEIAVLRAEVEKLRGELTYASRIAYFDGLTDLPNRHGFDRYVHSLQALSQTMDFQIALDYGRGGGVLVAQIDIDHFKDINTHLGHFGGDAVLREFAHRIAGCTRANAITGEKPAGVVNRCLASLIVEEYLVRSGLHGSDLISRWGGEEFFCIFPLCYRDSAAATAAYDDADLIVKRLVDTVRREPIIVSVNDGAYEHIKTKLIGNDKEYYKNAQLIDKNGLRVALPLSISIGYTVISWEEFTMNAKHDPTHLFRNVVDLLGRAKKSRS